MLVKKVMDAYFKKFYDGGFKQGKIETAKNMLLNKLPLDVIVDCTKLSLSEIKKFQQSMQ